VVGTADLRGAEAEAGGDQINGQIGLHREGKHRGGEFGLNVVALTGDSDGDEACFLLQRDQGFEIDLPIPSLAAPVQRANAATAIAALRALDIEIPRHAFVEGVASAKLAGRLQRFDLQGIPVIADVGHNPQAARELAAWLRAEPVPGQTLAVFAALADKDVEGVVKGIANEVSRWFLAGLDGPGARGQSVDALAGRLSSSPAANGSRHADVQEALQAARLRAQAGDRILVFGSFHTVADALAILHSGQ
jgi:dihydrofolate synthase/folylpolyglutamate synthase